MSVFSMIRRSRQQAKEHNQKEADKAKKEATHAPYRHVPTHAAIDALSGAPPSWKQDDRAKILDLNRRRSAMAASGRDMRIPGPPSLAGFPRAASSLSHVSYPSLHANPLGNMPRAYSYTSVPPIPSWADRGVDMMYMAPDAAVPSHKGKEPERLPVPDSGRQSSASSKGSPIGSSGDSSSSQDDLEIRPTARRHRTMPPQSVGMTPLHQPAPSRPSAHRLHPSSRRASDASERGGDPAVMARAAAASSYDRRPPAAMHTRSYGPIPAHNPVSPAHSSSGFALETPMATSHTGSMSSQQSLATAQASLASFNFGTNSTAPSSAAESTMMSVKSSVSVSALPTPTAAVQDEPYWDVVPGQTADLTEGSQPPKAKERRVSKTKVTRFTELETIDSNVEHAPSVAKSLNSDYMASVSSYPEVGKDATVREIAQDVLKPAPVPSKGRRLSKQPPGGAKLSKKSRWTTQRNSTVAA